MIDVRSLKVAQMDALREVANIGAGHAATALSTMTGQTIMITVPQLTITPIEEVTAHGLHPEEPVAAVLMHMMGDLSGQTMLLFASDAAMRLSEMMLHRKTGSSASLGEMEQSAVKEAGNILSGAYMNALSDFMGLVLLPSPPALAIDMAEAVLSTARSQFTSDRDVAFCIETQFYMQDRNERLRGLFLLLPDESSLKAILRAVRMT
jgi:chemotaxis protein CheC